ncbi:PAAR domain-containing protein [Burkholderia gladioli]|uniref:PAAR domain-containing protein n=1 Tax=Burkholderia gladioli TaxID=28095 RepID=UPI001640C20D|nr:PAAR domain-containing protein [Burkholderia gladioli]
MKRNYLRVGDCSTSGGRVVDGIASMTCDGIELTYVGAEVSCPACRQTGIIVAAGPRWADDLMGRQAALEGDEVACGCDPRPTMVASQCSMFQSFESNELRRMGFTSPGLQPAPDPELAQPSSGICFSCMLVAARCAASMIVRQ